MLGFLNPSGTQASIGNDTEKLPTPASTMDKRDLRRQDAAAAGAQKVYPYSPHDIVQTPEAAAAAAASRTSTFDNSIPGPAQTYKEKAEARRSQKDRGAAALAKIAAAAATSAAAAAALAQKNRG